MLRRGSLTAGFLACTPLLAAPDMERVARNAEELATQAASNLNVEELIVWLVTGLLIGSLVGTLVTRREAGFGLAGNLGLGLLGAFLGGMVSEKLGLELGLGNLVLSYDHLVAAAAGALVVVLVLLFVKSRYLKARTPGKKKSKD